MISGDVALRLTYNCSLSVLAELRQDLSSFMTTVQNLGMKDVNFALNSTRIDREHLYVRPEATSPLIMKQKLSRTHYLFASLFQKRCPHRRICDAIDGA